VALGFRAFTGIYGDAYNECRKTANNESEKYGEQESKSAPIRRVFAGAILQ
jgi:hypothetical protein